jgi:hypothetical protein
MSDTDERPRTAVVDAGLGEDERRELQRLRQEVATLRVAAAPRRRRIRWASVAAAVLLVLGCLGVPASVVAVWTHNQVADTDRFVATVSPAIQDPAVQSALTNRITSEVLAYIDVEQLANDVVDSLAAQGLRPQLVDRLRDLTGPLADGVAGVVHDRVGELVASPEFTDAWNRAIQAAHQQANAVLAGQATAIAIEGDMAVLELGGFIAAAKQRLVDSGFTAAGKIPQANPTIDLFPASTLVRAQTAYQGLDAVATWLPWITLMLLAAGVYLARHRRRAVLGVGLGVVAGMVVLAAALIVARAVVVGAVPEQGVAAAAATYDALVRYLRAALQTLAVLGLVVALGGYLAGPSTGAVKIRSALARAFRNMQRGRVGRALRSGPVGPWVYANRGPLRGTAVGLAVLVFVLLDRPTGHDIVLVALGLVLVLGVIQFIGPAPEPPTPAAATAADTPG